MKIGIFGFGCVGQGLYETLKRSGTVAATVQRICIRDPHKPRSLSPEWFTTRAEDLLEDPEIDVVVELIDDAEAAYRIVKSALSAGKSVVSANKKLVATHLDELKEIAQAQGVSFLYEGACCASIPIVRNLEEYYDNDLLEGISGIFNGSTNFILSRLAEGGGTYADALALAQELGFAESDPSLDVEGWDAAYKLAILVRHAFGVRVAAEQVLRQGISRLAETDLRYAREKGWKIRLLARAERRGNGLRLSVLPEFVQPDHVLFGVENEYNGVCLRGAFSEEQFFKGKGAGSLPTGSAVLSDLSALRYGYRYEYRKEQPGPFSLGHESLKVYFRFQQPETVAALEWEEIEESYRGREGHHVVGTLSTRTLQHFLENGGEDGFFVVLPEEFQGREIEWEPVSALELQPV